MIFLLSSSSIRHECVALDRPGPTASLPEPRDVAFPIQGFWFEIFDTPPPPFSFSKGSLKNSIFFLRSCNVYFIGRGKKELKLISYLAIIQTRLLTLTLPVLQKKEILNTLLVTYSISKVLKKVVPRTILILSTSCLIFQVSRILAMNPIEDMITLTNWYLKVE